MISTHPASSSSRARLRWRRSCKEVSSKDSTKQFAMKSARSKSQNQQELLSLHEVQRGKVSQGVTLSPSQSEPSCSFSTFLLFHSCVAFSCFSVRSALCTSGPIITETTCRYTHIYTIIYRHIYQTIHTYIYMTLYSIIYNIAKQQEICLKGSDI